MGCSVRSGTSGLTVRTALIRSSTTFGPAFFCNALISSNCFSMSFSACSSADLLPLFCYRPNSSISHPDFLFPVACSSPFCLPRLRTFCTLPLSACDVRRFRSVLQIVRPLHASSGLCSRPLANALSRRTDRDARVPHTFTSFLYNLLRIAFCLFESSDARVCRLGARWTAPYVEQRLDASGVLSSLWDSISRSQNTLSGSSYHFESATR